MKKPTNPNPEEFGRQVLFHLCGIHAEMQVVLHMMARERYEDLNACDQLYQKWMTEVGKIQAKLYREALEKSAIQPRATPPESVKPG